MTRVILLKDVPRIGKKYEVKEVSAGYAANYLFPNKLAEQSNPAKEADLAKKRDAAGAAKLRAAKEIADMVTALNGQTLTLTVKADEKGHLFKKVRAEDVAAVTNGLAVEHILLKEPIKTTGAHEIHLEGGGTKATFTLSIEKE
jgi:large subunit ribosomal protein L9